MKTKNTKPRALKRKRLKLSGIMVAGDPPTSAHWTPALEATRDGNGIVHPEHIGIHYSYVYHRYL